MASVVQIDDTGIHTVPADDTVLKILKAFDQSSEQYANQNLQRKGCKICGLKTGVPLYHSSCCLEVICSNCSVPANQGGHRWSKIDVQPVLDKLSADRSAAKETHSAGPSR